MNGLLILNKPTGVTSRQAVDVAERWFPGEKIGHAGTLDPLATGVLVLCIGAATRLIEYVQALDKTYQATLRLGARSNTDDADGTIEALKAPPVPEAVQLAGAANAFIGEILQRPPAYSARRVRGRRAHHFARKGKEVPLQPRLVRIDRITIRHYLFPSLELTVDCGKGTYIRSLARDLGDRLGCGAVVTALERTRIGPFQLADALHLDCDGPTARLRLLPAKTAVAHLPALTLPTADLHRLRQGQILGGLKSLPGGDVAVFDAAGELAAIARSKTGDTLKASKVL
jgi:tRNA pseudouridine55 synthase